MSEHARLSPSAAERWLTCPASVRMAAKFPDSESPYATEGTQAHALAELVTSLRLGHITEQVYATRRAAWAAGVPAERHDEMQGYAEMYAELIRDLAADLPYCQVLLERRVDTGIEDCWGTGDAILVSPEVIHVVDLKYGRGVAVSAEQNPQMMFYGLGGLAYGDLLGEIAEVRLTVFQPRINNVSHWAIEADELRSWRETVRALAAEAQSPNARFSPSEKACRWCPASGSCPAQMSQILEADFGDPDLMSGKDYAEALSRAPMLREWLKALEEAALRRVHSEGKPIPGWKVVRSGGRRSISDHTAAIQTLIDAGFAPEQVANFKARPLGELEKIVGGSGVLSHVLGNLLIKSEPKPSLVPSDDKRPEWTPEMSAAEDFSVAEM